MKSLYLIGISLIPGVGDINGKKLISYCGGPEEVFKTKKAELLRIPGIRSSVVQAIIQQNCLKRAEQELIFAQKQDIQVLSYLDSEYPERLNYCHDSPLVLYYKGNKKLNQQKIISIVGTRRATEYGKQQCENIIQELSDLDVLIVSGLAYGIDTYAHKFALKSGFSTIGVLAHGLDRLYPAANRELAIEMLQRGGLLTEFLSETNPDRENFPKRNRIVAGMSDATIVIESAAKGGALITADIANSYNKDVFAIPGRIGDKYSEGCNFLIKSHRANAIQSTKDIRYIMGWDIEKTKIQVQRKLFVELNDDEKKLVNIISESGEIGIDKISLVSDMPTSKTASILLNLEFEGVVKCMPGKVFKLVK